ncbi:MAG TPA: NUDIX domain-containing protein [Caulobacteraceae bacterium]|nr:NUDIX domain-containing protein [Caulobacteraceae bacterium]
MPAHLQFGDPEAGVKYRDRPAAFGVAQKDGRIAMACITREGQAPFYALPGGSIEPGESDARALHREVGEEVGLVVRERAVLARADQFARTGDGDAVNNRCVFFDAEIVGADPELKIEDTHELAWLSPEDALRKVRYDSHAWAIACWLRAAERSA